LYVKINQRPPISMPAIKGGSNHWNAHCQSRSFKFKLFKSRQWRRNVGKTRDYSIVGGLCVRGEEWLSFCGIKRHKNFFKVSDRCTARSQRHRWWHRDGRWRGQRLLRDQGAEENHSSGECEVDPNVYALNLALFDTFPLTPALSSARSREGLVPCSAVERMDKDPTFSKSFR
jgi:hypothetical protein